MAVENFNKLDVVTKEYLINNFINFDKDFLLNKYYLKNEGNEINNKISAIVGGTDLNSVSSDGYVIDCINKSKKLTKYYVETLVNPNDADENGIYLILDKNSIDEKSKFFVYTVIEQNGLKCWACISAPSVVFEQDNLDFDKEFIKYERKYKYSKDYCFINWSKLSEYINKFPYLTININSTQQVSGKYGTLQTNIDYDYEIIQVIVSNDDIYVCNENESEYKLYEGDKDEFAQKIINIESLEEGN